MELAQLAGRDARRSLARWVGRQICRCENNTTTTTKTPEPPHSFPFPLVLPAACCVEEVDRLAPGSLARLPLLPALPPSLPRSLPLCYEAMCLLRLQLITAFRRFLMRRGRMLDERERGMKGRGGLNEKLISASDGHDGRKNREWTDADATDAGREAAVATQQPGKCGRSPSPPFLPLWSPSSFGLSPFSSPC